MSKLTHFALVCGLAAAALLTGRLLATLDPDLRLQVRVVDVVELALPDLQAVNEHLDDTGGTGQVPVVCWTGPAYVLWAEGLNGRTGLVECRESLDPVGVWRPWPAPGLQQMLLPGAPPLTNIARVPSRFFRARVQ